MNILKNNINAFLLVFVSILVSVFFGTLIENFKSLIFLAFGAKILALLLWGVYIIPGIFLAKAMQYVFFANFDPNVEMIFSLAAIATFTPVLMMTMMKISKAGNMFNLENINFRHIIFFIIITAMLSDINFAHNAAVVMLEALFGQLFGGLFFVYVASKYAQPIYQIIKKLKFV